MAKNLMQDIKRRPTIKREIILNTFESRPAKTRGNSSKPKSKIWFIAFLSVILLFFALSFFFSSATITVTPKQQNLELKQSFSASKDNNSTSNLSFDLVVISGEETKTVKGDTEKNIETKAKGQIIIYNNYSTKTQTLVKNTSLEGSNGKIYKLASQVVVPGMTKTGGVGKVEATIYGSQAGEAYNSTPLDFKLPIFKGTAKYTKFYARSKGDISGGQLGKYYQISDQNKIVTIAELKASLTNKLSQKIVNQTPPGFILFKDAVFLNTNEDTLNTSSTKEDGMVSVTLKGTLYGFLFNESKITKKIAETAIEKYDGSNVHIQNIKDLTFTLSDKNISFADVKKIDFNLSGISKIVWDVDTDKLIASVLGKSKKEFPLILVEYKNLDSVNLKVTPPWKLSLPDKTKNIKIIVNNP